MSKRSAGAFFSLTKEAVGVVQLSEAYLATQTASLAEGTDFEFNQHFHKLINHQLRCPLSLIARALGGLNKELGSLACRGGEAAVRIHDKIKAVANDDDQPSGAKPAPTVIVLEKARPAVTGGNSFNLDLLQTSLRDSVQSLCSAAACLDPQTWKLCPAVEILRKQHTMAGAKNDALGALMILREPPQATLERRASGRPSASLFAPVVDLIKSTHAPANSKWGGKVNAFQRSELEAWTVKMIMLLKSCSPLTPGVRVTLIGIVERCGLLKDSNDKPCTPCSADAVGASWSCLPLSIADVSLRVSAFMCGPLLGNILPCFSFDLTAREYMCELCRSNVCKAADKYLCARHAVSLKHAQQLVSVVAHTGDGLGQLFAALMSAKLKHAAVCEVDRVRASSVHGARVSSVHVKSAATAALMRRSTCVGLNSDVLRSVLECERLGLVRIRPHQESQIKEIMRDLDDYIRERKSDTPRLVPASGAVSHKIPDAHRDALQSLPEADYALAEQRLSRIGPLVVSSVAVPHLSWPSSKRAHPLVVSMWDWAVHHSLCAGSANTTAIPSDLSWEFPNICSVCLAMLTDGSSCLLEALHNFQDVQSSNRTTQQALNDFIGGLESQLDLMSDRSSLMSEVIQLRKEVSLLRSQIGDLFQSGSTCCSTRDQLNAFRDKLHQLAGAVQDRKTTSQRLFLGNFLRKQGAEIPLPMLHLGNLLKSGASGRYYSYMYTFIPGLPSLTSVKAFRSRLQEPIQLGVQAQAVAALKALHVTFAPTHGVSSKRPRSTVSGRGWIDGMHPRTGEGGAIVKHARVTDDNASRPSQPDIGSDDSDAEIVEEIPSGESSHVLQPMLVACVDGTRVLQSAHAEAAPGGRIRLHGFSCHPLPNHFSHQAWSHGVPLESNVDTRRAVECITEIVGVSSRASKHAGSSELELAVLSAAGLASAEVESRSAGSHFSKPEVWSMKAAPPCGKSAAVEVHALLGLLQELRVHGQALVSVLLDNAAHQLKAMHLMMSREFCRPNEPVVGLEPGSSYNLSEPYVLRSFFADEPGTILMPDVDHVARLLFRQVFCTTGKSKRAAFALVQGKPMIHSFLELFQAYQKQHQASFLKHYHLTDGKIKKVVESSFVDADVVQHVFKHGVVDDMETVMQNDEVWMVQSKTLRLVLRMASALFEPFWSPNLVHLKAEGFLVSLFKGRQIFRALDELCTLNGSRSREPAACGGVSYACTHQLARAIELLVAGGYLAFMRFCSSSLAASSDAGERWCHFISRHTSRPVEGFFGHMRAVSSSSQQGAVGSWHLTMQTFQQMLSERKSLQYFEREHGITWDQPCKYKMWQAQPADGQYVFPLTAPACDALVVKCRFKGVTEGLLLIAAALPRERWQQSSMCHSGAVIVVEDSALVGAWHMNASYVFSAGDVLDRSWTMPIEMRLPEDIVAAWTASKQLGIWDEGISNKALSLCNTDESCAVSEDTPEHKIKIGGQPSIAPIDRHQQENVNTVNNHLRLICRERVGTKSHHKFMPGDVGQSVTVPPCFSIVDQLVDAAEKASLNGVRPPAELTLFKQVEQHLWQHRLLPFTCKALAEKAAKPSIDLGSLGSLLSEPTRMISWGENNCCVSATVSMLAKSAHFVSRLSMSMFVLAGLSASDRAKLSWSAHEALFKLLAVLHFNCSSRLGHLSSCIASISDGFDLRCSPASYTASVQDMWLLPSSGASAACTCMPSVAVIEVTKDLFGAIPDFHNAWGTFLNADEFFCRLVTQLKVEFRALHGQCPSVSPELSCGKCFDVQSVRGEAATCMYDSAPDNFGRCCTCHPRARTSIWLEASSPGDKAISQLLTSHLNRFDGEWDVRENILCEHVTDLISSTGRAPRVMKTVQRDFVHGSNCLVVWLQRSNTSLPIKMPAGGLLDFRELRRGEAKGDVPDMYRLTSAVLHKSRHYTCMNFDHRGLAFLSDPLAPIGQAILASTRQPKRQLAIDGAEMWQRLPGDSQMSLVKYVDTTRPRGVKFSRELAGNPFSRAARTGRYLSENCELLLFEQQLPEMANSAADNPTFPNSLCSCSAHEHDKCELLLSG